MDAKNFYEVVAEVMGERILQVTGAAEGPGSQRKGPVEARKKRDQLYQLQLHLRRYRPSTQQRVRRRRMRLKEAAQAAAMAVLAKGAVREFITYLRDVNDLLIEGLVNPFTKYHRNFHPSKLLLESWYI